MTTLQDMTSCIPNLQILKVDMTVDSKTIMENLIVYKIN